MANIKRTAKGVSIDMDQLRLANEKTIAIGNAKTNARGDLLGQGGKVIKSRAEIMKEYHRMNTQFAEDDVINESAPIVDNAPSKQMLQPTATDEPIAETESIPNYTKPRGSFAEAVAEQTEVKQELLDPPSVASKPSGVSRI